MKERGKGLEKMFLGYFEKDDKLIFSVKKLQKHTKDIISTVYGKQQN